MQLFLQNIQNEILKILKMFKNNLKFTRAACWINSKISNRDELLLVIVILEFLKVFNAVELHVLNWNWTTATEPLKPCTGKTFVST